jgi:hypothetical protein
MNRNRPANGSDANRRNKAEDMTHRSSGAASGHGGGGTRCAGPPYTCCPLEQRRPSPTRLPDSC